MSRTVRVALTLLVVAVLLGAFSPPGGARYRPAPGTDPAVDGLPRTGASAWPALDVAALGDSVTAGTNCGCDPFPEQYAADLHHRYATPVEVANDGVGGQTSADVLDELEDDDGVRADVTTANVVVLTIGANDFGPEYAAVTSGTCGGADGLACARPALHTLSSRLPAILAQIQRLRHDQPTAVLVTGYWNVFEDGDVAADSMTSSGLTTSDRLTRASNAITRAAAVTADATYVDLYTPFEGSSAQNDPTRLLADDGDHPNNAGHRLIAQTLLVAGLAPLTKH